MKMRNLRNIGQEIKDRRKFLQITQEELAEISGISLRSLKAIELGKANPSISQLNKVLDAIGLKIEIGKK
jgi:y4mF family transcriptional regulator